MQLKRCDVCKEKRPFKQFQVTDKNYKPYGSLSIYAAKKHNTCKFCLAISPEFSKVIKLSKSIAKQGKFHYKKKIFSF